MTAPFLHRPTRINTFSTFDAPPKRSENVAFYGFIDVDIVEVVGSSPISPTNENAVKTLIAKHRT